MEEKQNIPGEENIPQQPGYLPRPAWQVWGARILLVIFIILLICYYGTMLGGGS